LSVGMEETADALHRSAGVVLLASV
jgi:hypothetical protein